VPENVECAPRNRVSSDGVEFFVVDGFVGSVGPNRRRLASPEDVMSSLWGEGEEKGVGGAGWRGGGENEIAVEG
jgi:hypothetical protein